MSKTQDRYKTAHRHIYGNAQGWAEIIAAAESQFLSVSAFVFQAALKQARETQKED